LQSKSIDLNQLQEIGLNGQRKKQGQTLVHKVTDPNPHVAPSRGPRLLENKKWAENKQTLSVEVNRLKSITKQGERQRNKQGQPLAYKSN